MYALFSFKEMNDLTKMKVVLTYECCLQMTTMCFIDEKQGKKTHDNSCLVL